MGHEGERFIWVPLTDSSAAPASPVVPAELAAVLPDGYVLETSPAAEAWWRAAAAHLERGWLLAIDYGDAGAERWSPARRHGTFRGYREHQHSPDPLAAPGEQDLTAHVDFEAIRRAGEQAGLRTGEFCSQEQFLGAVLRESGAAAEREAGWSSAERRQLLTLLHPQHSGRSFRVLVQCR